jgi:RNA polymerase sigma-70 factor (ECF subfamily)
VKSLAQSHHEHRNADSLDGIIEEAVSDLQQFAPVYHQFAPQVYVYRLRRLGNREAAEDVTSMVFTRVLQSLPTYRNVGSSFQAWLFTIAHHAIADYHRQARRHPVAALDERAIDPRPSPEEVALIADDQERLRTLLLMLSSDQRRVVELRLAGLSGQEIAGVLGRSHGAVRQLQLRAMQQLEFLAGKAFDAPGSARHE